MSLTKASFSMINGAHRNVLDYGIVDDGNTDETSNLVSLMTQFGTEGFRGWVFIPYNTKFTVSTVYAAVPVGVILDDESSINWGQPPGYKNKFKIMFSGDSVSDDTQQIVGSGHHAAITLLNTGNSGSTSSTRRFASLLHGVNIAYNNDMIHSWMQTFNKQPYANAWQISWRLQTPYSVAIANPSPWVASTVYAANAYCLSDGGKVYTTVAGGTSGSTAPTGTGTGINDGGVLWNYVQAGLNLDSTIFYIDENGNSLLKAISGTPRMQQTSGTKTHYFEINSTNGDITWRDSDKGLNILTDTEQFGLQFGIAQSVNRITMTGATPNAPSTGAGKVSNGGATNMTNMVLPSGRTKMIVSLRFDNGNTTLVNGVTLVLKGGVNVTPATGSFMTFEYDSSFSTAWYETSRSF